METDKQLFDFFNDLIFRDYSENYIEYDINNLRKYTKKRFIRVTPKFLSISVLEITDDNILKIYNKDLDGRGDDMELLR